jgi:hypothetical protein
VPRETEPGYLINTFTKATQEKFLEEYLKKYPKAHPTGPPLAHEERFVAPEKYNDRYDHFKNFFESVRTRNPVVEDASFGFRAAGAALLANRSYDTGNAVKWDPVAMKLN